MSSSQHRYPRVHHSNPLYSSHDSTIGSTPPSVNVPNHSSSPKSATQFYSIKTPLPEYIRELIDELKAVSATQAEIITELKIKLAVYENKLQRAGQDKESITNSLGIVIETLARSRIANTQSAGNENCGFQCQDARAAQERLVQESEMEMEIELLRKNNKRLERRLKEETQHPRDRERARSMGSPSRFQGMRRNDMNGHMENMGSLSRAAEEGMVSRNEGYGALVDDEAKHRGSEGNLQHELNNRAQAGESLTFSLPTTRFSYRSRVDLDNTNLLQPKETFTSNITTSTIPNTSILPTQKLETSTCTEDVGLHTLDDILGDEDITIDAQTREHMEKMRRFEETVKLGVIKTGIENGGSFRGRDYENGLGRGNERMRDYERSAAPALLQGQSSSFDERKFHPGTSKTLWTSAEEREDAIRHNQAINGKNAGKAFVDFFRYGITFKPTETDSNFQRAVQIGNLPKDIQLRDVLARVRGGEIVSAVLCDTWKITGGMSVLVHFLHEGPAEEYVEFVTTHPISFSCSIDGEQESESNSRETRMTATITLLETASWPLSIPSHRRIHEHSQTRCLLIPHFPNHISLDLLLRDLACHNALRAASLININLDDANTLSMEFSSIDAAGSAFGILANRSTYSKCQVSFVEDPCKRPLVDLLSPVGPRKKMKALMPVIGGDDVELKIQCRNCEEDFESNNRLHAHLKGVHNIGGYRGFESSFSYSSSAEEERYRGRGEVSGYQRKAFFAAHTNQGNEIPSFSDARITASSWADEVIEEASSPPTSQSSTYTSNQAPNNEEIQQQISTLMTSDLNESITQKESKICKDRKAPMGLAGSKYATLVPRFEDSKYTAKNRTPRGSISLPEDCRTNGDERKVTNAAENSDDEVTKFLNEVDATYFEASESEPDSQPNQHPLPTSPKIGKKQEVNDAKQKIQATISSTASAPITSALSSSTPGDRNIRQLFRIQNPCIEKFLIPDFTKNAVSGGGGGGKTNLRFEMWIDGIKMRWNNDGERETKGMREEMWKKPRQRLNPDEIQLEDMDGDVDVDEDGSGSESDTWTCNT